MRKWGKLYWDRCLSVVAILSSTVAIYSSCPLVKPIGIDYMGVLVGILSLLVTMLIGWQIMNYLSFEEKIKAEIDKTISALDKKINDKIDAASNSLTADINKTREDLAISGVRSSAAILYKAESINLNMYLLAGKSNCYMVVNTLEIMLHYATALNEYATLSDIARVIVESKQKVDNMGLTAQDYEKVCNSFLGLSQNALTHLSASDPQVPHLLRIINELQNKEGE